MHAEMAAIMSRKAFSSIWIVPLLNETHDSIPGISPGPYSIVSSSTTLGSRARSRKYS
jgi:hypothetical protein